MSKQRSLGVVISFVVLVIALGGLIFLSANMGTIQVDMLQLLRGLFIEYDADVATIYDLRFPRIVISVFAGAALAVSGTLFQAVLKNPLADPGIIGVSSGAGFVAVIAAALFPALYAYVPLFGFLGGVLAFVIVYSLSWKKGFSPLRILLVGIAVQSLFTGLSSAFNSLSGGNLSGVASIVEGNITMKTWTDVHTLMWYVIPGLVLALCCARSCDLLGLEDKTAKSLGMDVNKNRFFISMIAVLLAASATAIVGVISFLGLLVPHIGRLIVGNKHKLLLPFSALLGAFVFLLADTIGRSIMPPYEINAAVVMSIIGGPVFIFLLRRSGTIHGK